MGIGFVVVVVVFVEICLCHGDFIGGEGVCRGSLLWYRVLAGFREPPLSVTYSMCGFLWWRRE